MISFLEKLLPVPGTNHVKLSAIIDHAKSAMHLLAMDLYCIKI